MGYGGRSSIGALLLVTEGLTSLLLNHSRTVGFPTMLCTLSRGRSLSLCRERWCQQINVHKLFCFVVYFWTVYTKANYPYPAARSKRSLAPWPVFAIINPIFVLLQLRYCVLAWFVGNALFVPSFAPRLCVP